MPGGKRQALFESFEQVNAIRLDPAYVAMRYAGRSAAAGFARRMAAFARKFARSIVDAGGIAPWFGRLPEGRAMIFTSTTNQTAALAPVAAELGECVWVTYNQGRVATGAPQLGVPDLAVHLVALLTLPVSILFMIVHGASRPTGWRSVAFAADELARTVGYRLVARWMIRRLRSSAVVMSNDHNSINRALAFACREQGVKSIYIQHAPVSPLFPPLAFDTAFVDGEHAADIYRRRGGDCAVVVTGASRFGPAIERPALGELGRPPVVSLALNKVDDPAAAAAYLALLKARGLEAIVRPHPGMGPTDLAFLPADVRLDRRPVAEHLGDVDLLIAGNSGILLDAFMAGVIPVAARDLSPATADYYGFIAHRAVYDCTLATLSALLDRASELSSEDLRQGMAFYNAALTLADGDDPVRRQARLIAAGTTQVQGGKQA